MAADVFEAQFTQIYNGLFRDPRLSFKAKGIFGLISTHRDGYGISLESISACAPDGISGVRTGLRELIQFDYLQRDRQRDDLGRLGQSVYFITDMPDGLILSLNPTWLDRQPQNPSTGPRCDIPHEGAPTVGEPPRKKNNSKKTNVKNPNSFRPSTTEPSSSDTAPQGSQGDQAGASRIAGTAAARPGDDGTSSPGCHLLNAVANECGPEFLLTGQALSDQGRKVTAMLELGWTPEQIRHVVMGEPWPVTITTSRQAIIAGRLSRALSGRPPAHSARIAAVGAHEESSTAATWTPSTWTGRAPSLSPFKECQECGRPAQPGDVLCATCLDWPMCSGSCGISGVSGRRVDPTEASGLCPICLSAQATG
ncbi:hypothetical protein ACWDFH_26120 [Streptomyces kronopolitis]